MKKRHIILLVLINILLINNHIFAQARTGFTLGCNFAQLTGGHEFDSKVSRVGGMGGILWNVTLRWESSVEFGGYFSQQGNIYQSQFYQRGAKVTMRGYNKLDYIYVPLTWKQVWGDVYTKVGFYGEVLVQAESFSKTRMEFLDSVAFETDTLRSFIKNARGYDAGLMLGVGYITTMSEQFDFFVEASYKRGVLSIQKTYDPLKVMRNAFFTVGIGVIMRDPDKRMGTKTRRR